MRVGIISINMYSKKLNFACPLHTYAFQEFLRQNGVDATVVDYKPVYYNKFDLVHPYDYYVSLVERRIKLMETETGERLKKSQADVKALTEKRDGYQSVYHEREIRYQKFQNFIDMRYHKTETCYDSDLLEVLDPGFDCYICATDVIWKCNPNVGFDRGFFLASSVMEGKWKLAYAASRGVSAPLEPDEFTEFFHNIEDIDYISTREESLKDYIEENTDREVSVVLDPVMLHDRSFYDAFAAKPAEAEEGYVFLYYVMERAADTIANAVKYAKAHNLLIVELSDYPTNTGRVTDDEGVRHIFRYDVGIEEWLGYIRYATAVFTNSFHGTCFSILFEQNFFAGSRNGDKVTNVIRTFGLEDRRIDENSDLINNPPAPIDYEPVRKIMEQRRKESGEFVLSALKEMEGRQKAPRDYDTWKRGLQYPVLYNSKSKDAVLMEPWASSGEQVNKLKSGSLEFNPAKELKNDGTSVIGAYCFKRNGFRLDGWTLRIKIDNRFFWYTEKGTLAPYGKKCTNKKMFRAGEPIPYIPVNRIKLAVAEGIWVTEKYPICYRSGKLDSVLQVYWGAAAKKKRLLEQRQAEIEFNPKEISPSSANRLADGSLEVLPSELLQNDGTSLLASRCFSMEGVQLTGWHVRVQIENQWFWFTKDDSLAPCDDAKCPEKKLFRPEAKIPCIPSDKINMVIAEGVWEETSYPFCYNSGETFLENTPIELCLDARPKSAAMVKQFADGAVEICPDKPFVNDGSFRVGACCFSKKDCEMIGWNLRVKTDNGWFWYTEDGTLSPRKGKKTRNKKMFRPGDTIPVIPADHICALTAVGVWQETFLTRLRGKLRRIKRRLTRKF